MAKASQFLNVNNCFDDKPVSINVQFIVSVREANEQKVGATGIMTSTGVGYLVTQPYGTVMLKIDAALAKVK